MPEAAIYARVSSDSRDVASSSGALPRAVREYASYGLSTFYYQNEEVTDE